MSPSPPFDLQQEILSWLLSLKLQVILVSTIFTRAFWRTRGKQHGWQEETMPIIGGSIAFVLSVFWDYVEVEKIPIPVKVMVKNALLSGSGTLALYAAVFRQLEWLVKKLGGTSDAVSGKMPMLLLIFWLLVFAYKPAQDTLGPTMSLADDEESLPTKKQAQEAAADSGWSEEKWWQWYIERELQNSQSEVKRVMREAERKEKAVRQAQEDEEHAREDVKETAKEELQRMEQIKQQTKKIMRGGGR